MSRVGKYEVGRSLGEGSFAKVKVGRNVETGQQFAVKIIDKKMILKHRLMHQVKREITTMKLVKHPNIVRLHEVLASKSKVYLVMEYVRGGELSDRICYMEKLTEEESRKYFHQLIDAVDYCHSRNVYHRDLKPQNLLLDRDGNLKVSDFGLSVLRQTDDALSTTCGSPDYAAPEVLLGQQYYGAAADIWSCGVILFEMLAGYSPFEDSNLMKQYQKICKSEFSFPLWFPFQARTLIKRILDPNPEARMTIAEVIQDNWFKKGYTPLTDLCDNEGVILDDLHTVFDSEEEHSDTKSQPVFINAFEIIAMSDCLDLSRLFEKNDSSMRKLFPSNYSLEDTMRKIMAAAKPLGLALFRVDAQKVRICGAKMTNKRGPHLSLLMEVIEVVPTLSVVEVWKSEGDEQEFKELCTNISKILSNSSTSPKTLQKDEASGATTSEVSRNISVISPEDAYKPEESSNTS